MADAGLGLPALTLREQNKQNKALEQMGLGPAPSVATPAPAPPMPQRGLPPAGNIEGAITRGRQQIADNLTGLGNAFGTDALDDAADLVGPSEASVQAEQLRQNERDALVASGEKGEVAGYIADVADIAAGEALPMVTDIAAGAAGGEAARAGGKLARFQPKGWKMNALVWGGRILGAGLSNYGQARDSSIRAAGFDPDSDVVPEAVKEQATFAALAKTALEEVVPLRALARIMPARADTLLKQGLAAKTKRVAGSTSVDAAGEVLTEVGEQAIDDLLMVPGALDALTDAEIADIGPYLSERYGSWEKAKGLFAAGTAGGATGGISSAAEEVITTRRGADAAKMAKHLEPLGMTTDKAAEVLGKQGGAELIQEAVPAIGTAETRYRLGVQRVDEAIKQGMDPAEAERAKADLLKARNQVVDTHANALGLPLRSADLVRQEAKVDAEVRTEAVARLRARGMRPDGSTDQIVEAADRLDYLDNEVSTLDARTRVTVDPALKAETQAELDAAKLNHRTAQIEAKMTLEGKTRGQAEREVAQRVQTEAQAAKRAQAIEKQLENEFPDSMPENDRRAKAEALVAGYEDNPSEDEKNLRKKIRRLEGRRRKATNPETIDSLSEDIAELEARQGLPTPAVEAAQRVLQDLGPQNTTEAGASRPVSQPTLAAAEDTVEGGVVPKPETATEAAASTPDTPADPVVNEAARRLEVGRGVSRARGKKTQDLAPNVSPETRTALVARAVKLRSGEPDPAAERQFGRDMVEAGYRKISPRDENPDYAAIGRQSAVALVYAANEEANLGNDALLAEGNIAPEDDPRRAGYDDVNEWRDLLDVVGQDATQAEVEERIAEWTAQTGKEASAHFAADGTLLGVGTNNLRNGVMPPRQGFGDPTVTFSHTHPVYTPLSGADVRLMMDHGGPIRAVYRDGTISEARPLKPLPKTRLQAMTQEIIRASDAALPADMAVSTRASIRQEVLLQHLENIGVIEYTQPFTNMTQEDQDHVATILEEADAGLRRKPNDRAGAAPTRATQGPSGADVSGQPERLATPEARAKRDARTVADRDRIRSIADRIYDFYAAGVPGERRPRNIRRAIRDGVSRAQIRKALTVGISGIGNKSNSVLRDVAYVMFPDLEQNPQDHYRPPNEKELSRPNSRHVSMTGDKLLAVKEDSVWMFSAALQVLEAVAETSPDGNEFIFHDKRNVKQLNSNRKFPAFVVGGSKALLKNIAYTGSPTSSLMPPMEDPDNTDQIVKKRDMAMTDEQQAPAKATARVFQRNTYTVDPAVVDGWQPEDLISGKGLRKKGVSKGDDIPRWREVRDKMEAGTAFADLPDDDKTWWRSKGVIISEQMRTARIKLDRFRQSVEEHQRLYPGEPVGFQYQIDNKGRIYADGDLNPQTSDAVKKAFKVDGVSLGDMSTVDASASGWQVAALIARDDTLAPQVNLGKGQATTPGFTKQDMYLATVARLKDRVLSDASRAGKMTAAQRKDKAIAQKVVDEVLPKGMLDQNKAARDLIKTPVIAVNYAATVTNFQKHFGKALATEFKGGKAPAGMGAYLGRQAYNGLADEAPNTMAMQEWALDTIAKTTEAAETPGVGTQPQNTWTVGSSGTYKRLKFEEQGALIRFRGAPARKYVEDPVTGELVRGEDGDPVLDKVGEAQISETDISFNTGVIAAKPTARSVYSQIIQGFDASILHETVKEYTRLTDGAFITTNHDAFTVPPENEAVLAAAVRSAMHKVMTDAGDVPMRIYNDAVANLARVGKTPEEVGITRPPEAAYGNYDMGDVLTSTPVFGEDADGNDYVPEYADLPSTEPEAAAASDEGDLDAILDPVPELARAVDVADYMEEYPAGRRPLQKIQQFAASPGAHVDNFFEGVEAGLTNQLQPIRSLEKDANGGHLGSGMDSAFKSAEMAVNDSGRAEQLMNYGAIALGDRGEPVHAAGTVGIKEILKTASGGTRDGQQLQHWQEWMLARRAKQLNAQGIKTPQTAADIKLALARERPEFLVAADMWKAHNDANLRLLKDSGRITEAQRAAMAADAFYIPFYRSDQEVGGAAPDLQLPSFSASSGGQLIARDPGIKAMKGGDKLRIKNVAETMMRNSQSIAAAAMRNNAANKTFDMLETMKMVKKVKAGPKKPAPDAVRMWDKGAEFFIVPTAPEANAVIAALGAFTPMEQDGVRSFMNGMARLLRNAVTLNPAFILTNLARGMIQTGILTQGGNLTMGSNTVTGLVKTLANQTGLAKSESVREFMLQSGMGDYSQGLMTSPETLNDVLTQFGLNGSRLRPGYLWRKFQAGLEIAGTATEFADRVALYDTLKRRGVDADEAAYQALNVMNYGRRGGNPTVKRFLSSVPFLNATIQGFTRLLDGTVNARSTPETRRQALARMVAVGTVYMAATAGIWQWNHEDEEREERYKQLPLWRKTYGLNIIPNDPDAPVLTIPAPFEMGALFSTIWTAALDQWAGDMENEFGLAGKKVLIDSFTMNLIPHAYALPMEQLLGRSMFTGRDIETMSERRFRPSLRTANASDFTRKVWGDSGAADATRISPARMEHALRNGAGPIYLMVAGVFNTFAADYGLVPPKAANVFGEDGVSRMMKNAFKGFVFDDQMSSGRFSDAFYRLGQEATEQISSTRHSGDLRYLESDTAPDAYTTFNQIKTRLSELRKGQAAVERAEDLTPEDKRRALIVIYNARDQLFQLGVEHMSKALQEGR